MLQVIHDVNGGKTRVLSVPIPIVPAGHVLIGNTHSIISAGTERYVVQLAKSSLISKARQRPDHVRRVLQKMREEGLIATLTQVKAKLNEPLALGYSAAGVVLSCGTGVHDLKVGDRVTAAGPHAAVVSLGRNLCARVPEGVSLVDAAYAPLGAIALQGVRLAHVELGSRVLVIGLGLLGLMSVGLLKAQGCRIWGLDIDASKAEMARTFGAEGAASLSGQAEMLTAIGPDSFDAVIITAASQDSSTIQIAADAVRARGRVVAVGLVGLDIPREPFFRKEIELTVSHSLGVGRGNARYETSAHDYPVGQARWTVRRNIETVLISIASGILPVNKLTSHAFPVSEAGKAYELITEGSERYLGIVLEYDDCARQPEPRLAINARAASAGQVGLSLIGAGNFARLVMLPKLAGMKEVALRGLCTAKGLNAADTGSRYSFTYATSDAEEVWRDSDTSAVVVATRHDLHSGLVAAALKAGKHVFVEKPLCLTVEEVCELDDIVSSFPHRLLMVGFNRRFSPALQALRRHFSGIQPLSVHYRFAVPELSPDIWVHDDEIGGGRIIGEACHAIDACAALVDSLPVRVYAESAYGESMARADDRVFISMRHVNGSISSVSYQAGGDRAMPAERIEIIGGGKSAVLDNWSELSVWSKGSVRRTKFAIDKGHAKALEAFVRTCAIGGDWPIAWESLRASSLAAILAERSTREGVPFTLSDIFPTTV